MEITTESKTAIELRDLELRRAQLIAKLDQETVAKDSAPREARQAAVDMHSLSCPYTHAFPEVCTWERDPKANDVDNADWAEEQHARWLGMVLALYASGWLLTR